jgi:hypothetical protein
MAEISQTQVLPPEFIEAAAKPFIKQLQTVTGELKEADLSKVYGPQFTAGLGALTQQAIGKVGGLGAYAPYLQEAGRLAGEAETTLGGIPTDIAAARGALGTAEGDIAAARGMIGPTAYQQYMSPYQQDIIDTALAEYDIQAQKGLPALAQQAIAAGAFGGGREGVQRAEYQTASDRNRAALQAQLLQQGFTQAQQLAQQAQAQRAGIGAQQMGLAGQQLGVGQAQLGAQLGLAGQQLGLGQFQAGLAGQAPALAGQEISALTTLGGLQQSQQQAQLAAQQQLAQAQLQQPLQATQALGSGITSLIAGYPGATTTTMAPSPSPLQTALGAGATLAGVYRAFS